MSSQTLKSQLKYFYDADSEALNFTDTEGSADYINKWVNKLTNGKIANLIEAESLEAASVLLINAIYFRGLWRFPFEETVSREFLVKPETPVEREFAEMIGDFYYFYSKNLQAKLLRLPYQGGRFSMFIILPFEADGLENLVNNLDSQLLRDEVDRMVDISVHVLLPKFRFDTSINLNQIVKDVSDF